LQISSNTISMALDLDVQQPAARPQNTAQVICPMNYALGNRLLNQQVLRIFDPTSTREAVPSAENFQKLLVGESFLAISSADLPREHGREIFIERNEFLCYCLAFCLECVEDPIARFVGWCKAVEGVDQFPGEVVRVH
jgi:hypothetical protein